MMSKLKLVIVPAWLNLIMKELDIKADDLADCEKLSGILSPRDLLIYKMVNFEAYKVVQKFIDDTATTAQIVEDFVVGVPFPTVEERASCANISLDTLIYGATSAKLAGEGLCVEVELTELEVLVIRLISVPHATPEQLENTDTLAKKMSKLLHARLGLKALAEMGAFERFIDEVPTDRVFY